MRARSEKYEQAVGKLGQKWVKAHGAAITFLLTKGANVDIQDNEGNTAMHVSVTLNYTQYVRQLLEKNARPDLKNKAGETPLSLAASKNVRIVKMILTKGFFPEDRNYTLDIAAVNACKERRLDILELLLKAGACAQTCDNQGNTLLHIAATFQHPRQHKMIQVLLENGADGRAEDARGTYPKLTEAELKNFIQSGYQ